MALVSKRVGTYKKVEWKNITVGTKLIVHSKEWFDANCNKDRDDDYEIWVTMLDGSTTNVYFTRPMIGWCGSVVTVTSIENGYICIDDMNGINDWCWYPEMFRCIVS